MLVVRIRRQTSSPSIPGRFRSKTTRSGLNVGRTSQGALTVGDHLHDVLAGGEGPPHSAADLLLVVDDEHSLLLHRSASAVGTENANVAPPPGVSSTQTSPPISCRNPLRSGDRALCRAAGAAG